MDVSNYISILSPVILGSLGFGATIYYAKSSKKRENDKIMIDLFREFNSRYDQLNGKLYCIINKYTKEADNQLTQEEKSTLYDFFNLCAEEYYWYKKGRIDPKLWKSWNAGMNFWYSHSIIKNLWLEEMKTKNGKTSYYLDKNEAFFE